MQTILPKKAGQTQPMALDDDHYQLLAADSSIQEFPQGSTYDTFNSSFSKSSTFGSPSTGDFGQFGNFGSAAVNNFGRLQQNPQSQPNLTVSGSNAAQRADVLVANDNADWINKKWRPAMGWLYMITCTFDFVIFPILWSLLQAMSKGTVTSQWQPLTLQGAGLYHIAMGAVLGIAAYGRTKEKLDNKQ